MPIDIRLRYINSHLEYFTDKTQYMISDFVTMYFKLIKEQEGIWRHI